MNHLIIVRKVSEQFQDHILKSTFMCTFENFMDFLNSKDREEFIIKDIDISNSITGKFKIYPAGFSPDFRNFVSIFLQAQWKRSKSVTMKFETAVLDTYGNIKFRNQVEHFKRVPTNTVMGDPQVIHIDMCKNDRYNVLDLEGGLNILLYVSVHIGKMTHPEMLEKYCKEYKAMEMSVKELLRSSTHGDAALIVENMKFYVEREILIQGNPMFSTMFAEDTPEDGVYRVSNIRPDIFQHILIDCYLNGGDDNKTVANNNNVRR